MPRCDKTPAALRDRSLSRTDRAGSLADVHSPPAKAVGRQHPAGHVAMAITAVDEADAKAMAMAPVVVMRVLRHEQRACRSGAGQVMGGSVHFEGSP